MQAHNQELNMITDRALINEEDADLKQFITFRVCDQEYGIDIMSVREIKGWTETTSLPNAPLYMRGVINLRGSIVPILDLRARFGSGYTKATSVHVVMIVNVGDKIMGILVDAVSDILTIHTDKIRPVPDAEQDKNVLTGIVNMDNKMVALIMIDRLFNKDIHFEAQDIKIPSVNNQNKVVEQEINKNPQTEDESNKENNNIPLNETVQ